MPKYKGRNVQNHHIQYGNKEHKLPDLVLPVYQGEHWILSQIQRLKPSNCSIQFVRAARLLFDVIEPFAEPIKLEES